ncbi:MAG: choice-of-anchor J domain-containing protein [Bacteroidales bacterium]|nr:choice-of-anchor J domain-containing protein [Bacteroidales bacterium]
MKKLTILLIIVATVFATGCKKLPEFTSGNGSSGGGDTPTTVTPEVVTSEATEITENFAMLNGVISNYDESYTYERGFYWGTTAELGNFLSADDFGHGTFGAKFAGLTANTTYYFKAYAIISGSSSENAGYGEVKSFTTAGSSNLTVTTLEASEISSTSAVLNGMISNFGNDASEYECAFVWGTGTPTNYNNNVELWTDGKFNLTLTGLDPNTTYKFQAYAKKALTNDDGVYGEIMEFTTSSNDTIIFQSFENSQGNFTIQDVIISSDLAYVWSYSSNYKFMKASAYVGQAHESENWLISPLINLSNINTAILKFDQAAKYGSPQEFLSVMISTDYNGDVTTATWTALNISQWPAGTSFDFVNSSANLTPYIGKNITIAFKYTSTSSVSITWEVKNIFVIGDI